MSDSPRRSPPTYKDKDNAAPYGGGTSTGKGRRSGLKSRGTQLLAIRFGWAVLVIWFEAGEFFSSVSSCRFPDASLRRINRAATRQAPPSHVVLIADPHVPHPELSYSIETHPWINYMRHKFEILFMKKSWHVVMRLGRVDAVVMLGDMLDAGRGVMTETAYERYVELYRSIFTPPSPTTSMYYIPGNHDIPLGPHKLFSTHARERYDRSFSKPNSVVSVANHSLVLLDAVGLVEEDYRRYYAESQFGEWDGVEGGVIEFIKETAESGDNSPRILISHIPLDRPEVSCGPLREQGVLKKGAGPGYQNLLGSDTSEFLLSQLKPVVIFSGDDHDYCEHKHPGGIPEVTVKSFSSSTGIRRPGFQLLSLVPPPAFSTSSYADSPTFAYKACLLPDQSGTYFRVYIPIMIITVLYIFGTNIRAGWIRWRGDGGEDIYNQANGSYMKGRASPGLSRSNSVLLPPQSRRTSQQISGGSASTSSRLTRPNSPMLRSTPGSPRLTPRPSYDAGGDGDYIDIESPAMSRRSSFIYMNGNDGGIHSNDPYATPKLNQEPAGYFTSPGTVGLGVKTPTGPFPMSSSSERSSFNSPSTPHVRRHVSNPQPQPQIIHPSPSKRLNVPKPYSEKIDHPILLSHPGPIGGNGILSQIWGILKWVWRARTSVLVRSIWEVWGIIWVIGFTWVIVNGLFFLGA